MSYSSHLQSLWTYTGVKTNEEKSVLSNWFYIYILECMAIKNFNVKKAVQLSHFIVFIIFLKISTLSCYILL